MPEGAERFVPGWYALRRYERAWLGADVLAGLALTALLVPQGMAYAELAGLPAVTGLYTTITALLAYAVFGPSRVLVLGPDSALAPLILAAVVPLVSDDDPAQAVAMASVLALLMGIVCIGIGLVRLGNIAELLSKPVRVGYLSGLAAVVLVSQLPKLFGFSVDAEGFFPTLSAFLDGLTSGETEPAALAIGLGSLTVILAFRRWAPTWPGVLLAVVAATVAVNGLDLVDEVPVVGDVPSGFPGLTIPDVSLGQLETLVAAAIGIAFVTLADTTALSRSLAAQRGEVVDPNQEITALGSANIAAGLFQGFPVSASTSRTAVATSVGSRTQLTGVIGAVTVLAVLAFATGTIHDLPSSTLGAIVIAAAFALFDLDSLRWFWRVRRSELAMALTALAGVVVLGPLLGIVVAIAVSLGNFVRKARRPYDAVLGRIEGRKGYHDRERHPDARQVPGLLLYRFDAPLFFGNADHFRNRVLEILDDNPDTRWLVISAEPITDIDTTGAEALESLLDDLDERGIHLALAELKGPSKDRLARYGLLDRIGEDALYPTLGRTIDGYLNATGTEWRDWTDGDARDEREGGADD